MEITDTLIEDIRRMNDQLERHFEGSDVAGIVSLYAKDGSLLPPGSEPVVGRKAIASFWQGMLDQGVKHMRLQSVEVESFGNTAIELGQYHLDGAENQAMDHGKYIVMWKRDGEEWKIQRDIWNTSASA
ncbi:MAG TPA: DUF4440 domain-containing protein [Hymenobacter sp.]|jgi:uncharacterized protein (TIGR02246 family)